MRCKRSFIMDQLECYPRHESSIHSREGRHTIILSILSSPTLVSGLMVVHAKNLVHPVPSSMPVSRNTSGSPILLGPNLPAMISPMAHIGAIYVLSLPMVMMLNIQIAEIHEKVSRYPPVSGIIGLIPWWEMSLIPDNDHIPLLPMSISTNSLRHTVHAREIQGWTNSKTLGNSLHTYYSVWFLVSSPIPSIAMIGATILTMHRTTRVKRHDVF